MATPGSTGSAPVINQSSPLAARIALVLVAIWHSIILWCLHVQTVFQERWSLHHLAEDPLTLSQSPETSTQFLENTSTPYSKSCKYKVDGIFKEDWCPGDDPSIRHFSSHSQSAGLVAALLCWRMVRRNIIPVHLDGISKAIPFELSN